ncbi:hypothetical protein ACTXT7_011303, partial [Hymenolepis weldensis]
LANADALRIRELKNEKRQFEPVIAASCFPKSNIMVAVAGGHVFSAQGALSDVNGNYGFKCLSCGISDQTFAELSPEYKACIGLTLVSNIVANAARILVIKMRQKMSSARNTHLISPLSLSLLVSISAQFRLSPVKLQIEKILDVFILNMYQSKIERFEYFSVPSKVTIPNHFRNHERGVYYTTLPELIENRLQYRVAKLNFVKGGKIESHVWLTPKEYNVESLEKVMDNYVWFTSAFAVEGSKHLLRLDITDGSTICLTCFIGSKNETNVYSRLAYVTVSDDRISFAARFETGYEFFEPLQIQRSAATLLQNRLTGSITETYGEADAKITNNHLIKPILTCDWMEWKETGTDIYVFSYLAKKRLTKILWRSMLVPALLGNSTNSKNETVRKRRSVDTNDLFIPEEQLPPKLANKDDDAVKLKVKTRRLFKHMPLGLSFLVSNVLDGGEQFWMPYSTLRCLTIRKSALNTIEDDCNVLVRFWYPPTLNENHITQYAFLLIVPEQYKHDGI